MTDAPLNEQSLIQTSQRFLLEQGALDATEKFYERLLAQTPRAPAMGEFLFHLLKILESMGASAQGRRAIPGLHHCRQNHQDFLAAPAEAIRDRLLFASRVLSHFAAHAGAMDAAAASRIS